MFFVKDLRDIRLGRWMPAFLGSLLLVAALTSCDVLSSDDDNNGERDIPMIEQDIDISSPATNGLSDSISSKYRRDAKIIALRHVQEEDSSRIVIPERLIDFYWRGLIHIHKFNHPARDTVVNQLRIYNPRPDIITHEVVAGVDTSHDWTDAWANGEVMTGNESLDRIVEEYELTLEEVDIRRSSMVVVLRSGSPVNPAALGRTLEAEVPDFLYAEPNGRVGGGPFIKSKVNSERVIYTFSYGWGDCPAGCINRRSWDFSVFPSGEVSFEGSYGDQLNRQ